MNEEDDSCSGNDENQNLKETKSQCRVCWELKNERENLPNIDKICNANDDGFGSALSLPSDLSVKTILPCDSNSCLNGLENIAYIDLNGDKLFHGIIDASSDDDEEEDLYFYGHELQHDEESNFTRNEDEWTCSIHSFPDEILTKIFSYLNILELGKCVFPVCARWNRLAHQSVFWKVFNFEILKHFRFFNVSSLYYFLQNMPFIRRFVHHGHPVLSPSDVCGILSCCPNLVELDLGFSNPYKSFHLDLILENCTKITDINLEGNDGIGDKCALQVSKASSIVSINFSHCDLEDAGVTSLATNLPKIEFINIDGISWITDRGVLVLIEKHHQHLQHLFLDGDQLTDVSVQHISQCSNLKTLEISFCENITDVSLREIKKLKELRCLKLKKGFELSESGLYDLFHGPNLHSLEKLDMTECVNLGDTCMSLLAECCTSIRHLTLDWCYNITDIGIAYVMQSFKNLKIVDLIGLKKIIGKVFCDIPKLNPKLERLDLSQCNMIDDDMINLLISQKKDLEVIDYYGVPFEYHQPHEIKKENTC